MQTQTDAGALTRRMKPFKGRFGVFGPPHPIDGGDYAPLAVYAEESDARLSAAAPLLLSESIVLHSRILAILKCDDAVDALCADDVFGADYGDLLSEDEMNLRKAIKAAGGEVEEE